MNNLILRSDSYKHSHPRMYPPGINGMSAYIEARVPDQKVMLFGLQMYLQKLNEILPITTEHIEEAADFLKAHGLPFYAGLWYYIVEKYDGYLPITIYAAPEGLPITSQNPLVRIECHDPQLYWLVMFIETDIQRAVWYPSTVASQGHELYRLIKRYWQATTDDLSMLKFALHDFGARGVTCSEQAEIGGASHLVHFDGSDNIEGIAAANHHYHMQMAAYSVPATEHTVQMAWGPMQQDEYLEHVLDLHAEEGKIVSIVIDGYDTQREATRLCTKFRDKIVDSGAKVVFRPDSGDPLKIIPELLCDMAKAFGYHTNNKGFSELKHVGILQGDGVDKTTIDKVLLRAETMGFAANNVVFGSGGALLQKLNRDTYGFAQKASAIHIENAWRGIYKAPVTDSAKRSKAGRVATYRSSLNNEFMTFRIDQELAPEFVPIMRTVYDHNVIRVKDDLHTIRQRART